MKNLFAGRAWDQADQWHAAYVVEQGAHAVTRRQLVELTERLATLQRVGFSPSVPEPPFPDFPTVDPEIAAALNARFPGNSPHRGMILRQVEEWQLAGRENDWIARRIWDGEENVDG